MGKLMVMLVTEARREEEKVVMKIVASLKMVEGEDKERNGQRKSQNRRRKKNESNYGPECAHL